MTKQLQTATDKNYLLKTTSPIFSVAPMLLWTGVSVQARFAVLELLAEEKLFIHRLNSIFYVNERSPLPNYPEATVLKNYADTHWYPSVLSYSKPRK